MFVCQICGCTAPPRTPRRLVAVKSRPATYRPRTDANLVRRLVDGKHKEWHTRPRRSRAGNRSRSRGVPRVRGEIATELNPWFRVRWAHPVAQSKRET